MRPKTVRNMALLSVSHAVERDHEGAPQLQSNFRRNSWISSVSLMSFGIATPYLFAVYCTVAAFIFSHAAFRSSAVPPVG